MLHRQRQIFNVFGSSVNRAADVLKYKTEKLIPNTVSCLDFLLKCKNFKLDFLQLFKIDFTKKC
jgi:hypothetical protein